jgi:hypothetical protein
MSSPASIGISSNVGGLSGRAGGGDLHFETGVAEAFERRAKQLGTAATPGGGIHNC